MNYRPDIKGKKLPSNDVCARYNINRRTLGRWMVDAGLGFPEPLTINNRHYFDETELNNWERARAISSVGKAA